LRPIQRLAARFREQLIHKLRGDDLFYFRFERVLSLRSQTAPGFKPLLRLFRVAAVNDRTRASVPDLNTVNHLSAPAGGRAGLGACEAAGKKVSIHGDVVWFAQN